MIFFSYGLDAIILFFFFSSRRRHTRSLRDWSSDVCSSDLLGGALAVGLGVLGVLQYRGRRTRRVDIDEVEEIDRLTWRMPPLEELARPVWSTARKAGILVLRGYLVVAVLLVIGRVVQLALAGTGHA